MKILLILPRIPYPLEKGDKLRAYYQIKYLSQKHEVIIGAVNDSKIDVKSYDELRKFTKNIHFYNLSKRKIYLNIIRHFFSSRPFQVSYFTHNFIQKMIDKTVEEHQPDVIYCQLVRTANYAKKYNIPKVLDFQDAFSKGLERRIDKSSFFKKILLKMEAKRMRQEEAKCMDFFDETTIISEAERALIHHSGNKKIRVVPNGVETDFFKPSSRQKDVDVVFTGNMAYPPNVDAAIYLAKNIMPKVWEKIPEAKLLIAGANPDARVKALSSEKVEVTGWLDDIRDAYRRAKIFVAPMRLGIGMQNKVLEAMSCELPCITSDLVNRAILARPEKEVYITGQTREFADKIVFLLQNQEMAKQTGQNARRFVETNHNWQQAVEKLNHIFEQLIRKNNE